MSEQPEALRLAKMIEHYNAGVMSQKICEDYLKAAAELRRLHGVVERLLRERSINLEGGIRDTERIAKLEAQNAELLEALKGVLEVFVKPHAETLCEVIAARAAIAKGEQA